MRRLVTPLTVVNPPPTMTADPPGAAAIDSTSSFRTGAKPGRTSPVVVSTANR